MIDGFPTPDFDFDDDEEELPIFAQIPGSSHLLTPEEYDELCTNNEIQLTETPIRCTNNSAVYTACSQRDNSAYAIKISEHKKRIREEFLKSAQLPDSPFLVKSIACIESPTKALLQMELCEEGDISGLTLNEGQVWQLIHDIGSALKVIHYSGMMHLDISPGNILRSFGHYKLADFGTLKQIGTFTEGDEGAGPYVSPEALAYPGIYPVTAQTDIFSFGVVLLEVLTGKSAPRGGSQGYSKLRNGEIKIGSGGYIADCSEHLENLVNAMLSSDPNIRPTSEALVNEYNIHMSRCLEQFPIISNGSQNSPIGI
ncbi:CAMK family protein kinase [Histomonas meleagridis]|uniref:CAMK family protein kinase n=1 Tax=Histomonas meleagridis TaxID=135588 RepID=UPI0035594CC3|nr:CAMK family protein kinase [Histomonas meleagridis]KAH0802856.1 CAMK family protein kinase [Histomonas meleagridis]